MSFRSEIYLVGDRNDMSPDEYVMRPQQHDPLQGH